MGAISMNMYAGLFFFSYHHSTPLSPLLYYGTTYYNKFFQQTTIQDETMSLITSHNNYCRWI